MRYLLALLLLLPAFAGAGERDGEWWGVATLSSYHERRDRGYNESNFGLGAEYHINRDWHVAAGFYKNSFYRHTNYAAVGYEIVQFGYLHLGAAVVGLTGYTKGRVDFILAPVASIEYGRFGINLVPVTPEVVGLQVKIRF